MTTQHRDLTFTTTDGIQLAGTLTVPGPGRWPGVLILNGSGPLDRESAIKGQELGFAGALATQLAGVGIASFRFDKRGVAQYEGDFDSTGLNTEIDDAATALSALASADEVEGKQLAIVGHSVGAIIATRLAATDPAISAIVLLAGTAQDGRTTLAWQGARISASLPGPAWLLPKFARSVQQLGIRKLDQSSGSTVRVFIKRQPAQWMREFMAHDPAVDLRNVKCPVLAITGLKDLQVDPDDVARMSALVSGSFTGETPPNLTHVLRQDAGPGGILSYGSQLRHPIDPALTARISTWVSAQFEEPRPLDP